MKHINFALALLVVIIATLQSLSWHRPVASVEAKDSVEETDELSSLDTGLYSLTDWRVVCRVEPGNEDLTSFCQALLWVEAI
jgi:hypothetical protein